MNGLRCLARPPAAGGGSQYPQCHRSKIIQRHFAIGRNDQLLTMQPTADRRRKVKPTVKSTASTPRAIPEAAVVPVS